MTQCDAVPGAPALSANEEWMRRTTRRREELAARGTDVRLVAASVGGALDRIPGPLPLGHPDVVAAVETALDGAATTGSDPDITDYEDPEEFADVAGVDPTPEQVDAYRDRRSCQGTAHRRSPLWTIVCGCASVGSEPPPTGCRGLPGQSPSPLNTTPLLTSSRSRNPMK
ncbi:hypothetical protein LV75_005164 [Actinokineospora diospyrosa]|uniref:Uncharacterized protein n=1 Tax=Actinokineospora diospyrosa TaxID=103728 RepID=A0ABT1IIZ9_9PSEU|nr:hypothetical protein [Actinokineospora diospyrosa]